MNRHWGYNEHDKDFKSVEDLIRKLVDIASKNGNFLLNVGPTAEGLIPEESVARLRAIGRWMKVNHEAIYATQASPFTALSWGRCTIKDDGDSTILYLHIFDWPADGTLVVPGIGNDAQQACLLADRKGDLRVERTGTDLRIHLPQHAPDAICSVVALKVQGRPVIYETPQIVATSDRLVQSLSVKLTTRSKDLVIRSTLDGSDPTSASPRYAQPIRLTQTTTVKACAFYQDKPVSSVTAKKFTQVEALPAITIAHVAAGLKCEIYKGDWDTVPDFDALKPTATKTVATIASHSGESAEHCGCRLTGFIVVPHDDVYLFALSFDDGSRITIAGKRVVDNDGLHGAEAKTGTIALAAGLHPISIEYFNKTGGGSLSLHWSAADQPLKPVPQAVLKRVESSLDPAQLPQGGETTGP